MGHADSTGLVNIDVVDGWATQNGARMAGIRIQVTDGWKTYWRSPGDAGVPPQFDWQGSQNLAAVHIFWPRPEVFDTYGQRTLGYAGEIILPVELIPTDPTQAIVVAGQAQLGVCRDICVPVTESYGEVATNDTPAIKVSLAAQPSIMDHGTARCELTPIEDGLRLTATLAVPHQGGDEITVVELSPADVWVSEPVTARRGGMLTTTADLVPPNAMPFDLDRSSLRITVLGRDGATETHGCQAG